MYVCMYVCRHKKRHERIWRDNHTSNHAPPDLHGIFQRQWKPCWTKGALRQHGATVGRGWKNLELERNATCSVQVSRHWTPRHKWLRQVDKRGHSWKRRSENVLCPCIIVLGYEKPIRNKFHQIWRNANFWKGLWISRFQICQIKGKFITGRDFVLKITPK